MGASVRCHSPRQHLKSTLCQPIWATVSPIRQYRQLIPYFPVISFRSLSLVRNDNQASWNCPHNRETRLKLATLSYRGAGTATAVTERGFSAKRSAASSGHNTPIPLITILFYQRATGMSIYDNAIFLLFSAYFFVHYFYNLISFYFLTTRYCGRYCVVLSKPPSPHDNHTI